MTSRLRNTLFYSSILLFLILGSGVAFYAQGWRLDPTSFEAKKVGAIYVKSYPDEAQIYLDQELIKNQSGLFRSGTFINSLYPQAYILELSLPDFKPWKRTIEVVPSLVSEVKNAVLIPLKPSPIIEGPIKNFWVVDDKVLIQRIDDQMYWQNGRLNGNQMLGWTDDNKKLLTFDTKTKTYFWDDLEDGSFLNLNQVFRRFNYTLGANDKILVDPGNSSKLLLFTPASISLLDLQENTLSRIITSSTASFSSIASSPSWFGWTSWNKKENRSKLLLQNKQRGTLEAVSSTIPGTTSEIDWIGDTTLLVLQNDGRLYAYDVNARNFTTLAEHIIAFSLSRGEKIAAWNGNGIEIFSLQSEEEERLRFNVRDANSIKTVFWYRDDSHLFIPTARSIYFLDLEDEFLENFDEVVAAKVAGYAPETNTFYFLENQSLFGLRFPS